MPSKWLLEHYRNVQEIEQGWNLDLFLWCCKEADKLKLAEEDQYGGLLFDEMTIQENIRFAKVGKAYRMTGVVNLGQTYSDHNVLLKGKGSAQFCQFI